MNEDIKERREQLATKVIKARIAQGLTQDDLARRANVEIQKIHSLESQEYGDLKYVEVVAVYRTLKLGRPKY